MNPDSTNSRSWALSPVLRLLIGVLSLVLLLGGGVRYLPRLFHPAPTGPGQVSESGETPESLYAPGDKPMTLQLRGVSSTTGQLETIPVVIRQSRSRVNQMKQAVLAHLKGPREGKVLVPGAARMIMNGFYLAADGTAVVDLTIAPDPLFGYWEEAVFVRGLVFVLSNHFPEVKRVRLLMDGQESGTLAGHYALGSPASSYVRNAVDGVPPD